MQKAKKAAFIKAAEAQFPAGTRCVRCGFRAAYHEPSNHKYEPPVHPFVAALRDFVQTKY